ncbi:MAG TPA: hypothetical protein PK544_17225 [Spirochaetota bacterium]|nr:hypothetical protein [Spirochaetota bacterium]
MKLITFINESIMVIIVLFVFSHLFAVDENNIDANLESALSSSKEITAATIELFKKNIIEYFPVDEWDTPLKKKYLIKSQLYKEKKKEIDCLKKGALSNSYYAAISLKNGALGDSRYILRLKKMLIHIQSDLYYKYPIVDVCSDFYFKNIPARLFNLSGKELYGDDSGIRYRIVSIDLSMNEEQAYLIEKNINNAKCYIVFNIFNNIKVLPHYHRAPDYSFSLSRDKFIVAEIKKIIIGDTLNGSLYFEKLINK